MNYRHAIAGAAVVVFGKAFEMFSGLLCEVLGDMIKADNLITCFSFMALGGAITIAVVMGSKEAVKRYQESHKVEVESVEEL